MLRRCCSFDRRIFHIAIRTVTGNNASTSIDRPSLPMSVVTGEDNNTLSLLSIPTDGIQQCLQYMHESMHIPWWLDIATIAIIARTIAFPLFTIAERLSAKRFAIERSIIDRHIAKNPLICISRADMANFRQLQQQRQKLIRVEISSEARKQGVDIRRITILRLLSTIYPFFCTGIAIRNIIKIDESLSTGGCLWFINLTQPDPFMLLSVVQFIIMTLLMRSHRTSNIAMERYRIGIWIFMICVYVPISTILPSGVTFFWVCYVSMSLFQTLCLKHPTIKTILGIKPMPTDTRTPFRQLFQPIESK